MRRPARASLGGVATRRTRPTSGQEPGIGPHVSLTEPLILRRITTAHSLATSQRNPAAPGEGLPYIVAVRDTGEPGEPSRPGRGESHRLRLAEVHHGRFAGKRPSRRRAHRGGKVIERLMPPSTCQATRHRPHRAHASREGTAARRTRIRKCPTEERAGSRLFQRASRLAAPDERLA
jgi:hypothetical protein